MADEVAKTEITSPSKPGSLKISEGDLKTAKERIFRSKKKARKDKTMDKGGNISLNGTAGKKKVSRRPVVYISHLPHGFYEEELRGFFTQFGQVCRVKVSRSRKTGNSKGYAFVEFSDDDVARIAAETMNNYLMFERLVKTKYIPAQRVHPKMFPSRWITPESYPTLERRKKMLKKQEEKPTDEDVKKHKAQVLKSITRSLAVLHDMGIDDYLPLVYDPPRDEAHATHREKEVEASETNADNGAKVTQDKSKPEVLEGKPVIEVIAPAVGTPVISKSKKAAAKTPAKAPETDSSVSSKPSPAKISKPTPVKTPVKASNATTAGTAKNQVLTPKASSNITQEKATDSVKLTPAKVNKVPPFKTPEAIKVIPTATPAKTPEKSVLSVKKPTPAKTPAKAVEDVSKKATPAKTPSKETLIAEPVKAAATPERLTKKLTPAKKPVSAPMASQSPKSTPGKASNKPTIIKTPAKEVEENLLNVESAPIIPTVEKTPAKTGQEPIDKPIVATRALAKSAMSPARTPKKVATPKRVKEAIPRTPNTIEKPISKVEVNPKVEDVRADQSIPSTPAKSPKKVAVTPKSSVKKEVEAQTPNKSSVKGTPKAVATNTTGETSPSKISPRKRPADTEDNTSPSKVAAIRTPVSVLKSPAGRVVVTPLSSEKGDVVVTPKSPAITPPARRLTRAAAKRMSMKISPKMDMVFSPRVTRKVTGTPSTPAGRRKSVKP